MHQSQSLVSWPKAIFRILVISIAIFAGFLVLFYLAAPFYTFREPKLFEGPNFYNPYADTTATIEREIQINLNALNLVDVVLNGRLDINLKYYDSLVYEPMSLDISNFQFSHHFVDPKGNLLNFYRHGYGLTGDQQLCIGSRKVIWTDYPFIQHLRHKQDILEKVGRYCELVALTDPIRSYTQEELKYLSGYQLMEVTNTNEASMSSWDMALSFGHRVYLILSNLETGGESINPKMVHTNYLFVKENSIDAIIESLNKGHFYSISQPVDSPYGPICDLKNVDVLNGVMTVEVQPQAERIRFIGQNGLLLQTIDKCEKATYTMEPTDTYVRGEAFFADGSILYFNPVNRQEFPNEMVRQDLASLDSIKTAWMRGLYIVIIMLLAQLFFRWQIKGLKKQ